MAVDKVDNKDLSHEIQIISREKVLINGVLEVESFDDISVSLKTVCGKLLIEGEGLHIDVLDIEKGIVELLGKINSVFYIDNNQTEKKNIFKWLIKS